MTRFLRIGRAVTLLVARLVLANVAATFNLRERDLHPPAIVRPARPRDPRYARELEPTVAELLRLVELDEGCDPRVEAPSHRACAAAIALLKHAGGSVAVQAVLEQTIIAAGRPGCVRRSAVDTLSMLDAHTATRALRRMEAVTRRRIEFEGTGEDRELLTRLASALSSSSSTALTRH